MKYMREYGNVGDYFLLELPDFSVMDMANVVGMLGADCETKRGNWL